MCLCLLHLNLFLWLFLDLWCQAASPGSVCCSWKFSTSSREMRQEWKEWTEGRAWSSAKNVFTQAWHAIYGWSKRAAKYSTKRIWRKRCIKQDEREVKNVVWTLHSFEVWWVFEVRAESLWPSFSFPFRLFPFFSRETSNSDGFTNFWSTPLRFTRKA